MKAKPITLPNKQRDLLVALFHHPLLSTEQLAVVARCPQRTVQWSLFRLLKMGLVRRYDWRHPHVLQRHPTPLYALTRAGVAAVLPAEFASFAEFVHRYHYHLPRLERLALALERTYHLRQFILKLLPALCPEWWVSRWNDEVEFCYRHWGFASGEDPADFEYVPLHAAAQLIGRQGTTRAGRWVWLALEWDASHAPATAARDRFIRLVGAQNDGRFLGDADDPKRFPILVIIAQNRRRLDDYIETLWDAVAYRRNLGLAFPITYLTTVANLKRMAKDATAALWYSTESKTWTALLAGLMGSASEPQVMWVRAPQVRSRSLPKLEFKISTDSPPTDHTLGSLAQLAFLLRPIHKTVLDQLAHTPLVSASELYVLLDTSSKYIRPALARLQELALVERVPAPPRFMKTRRAKRAALQGYILADRGIRFLAAIDGFGRAVQRYVNARGWGSLQRPWDRDGKHGPTSRDAARIFAPMIERWEHTRAENEIMVQFIKAAARRRDQLTWWSECVGRLYYAQQITPSDPQAQARDLDSERSSYARLSGPRPWLWKSARPSFLPDGRAVYVSKGRTFHFALEVDRTHVRFSNIWDKLRKYHAALEDEDGGFGGYRLLIVTTGWERAQHLAHLVRVHGKSLVRNWDELPIPERTAALERTNLPVFITTFKALYKTGVSHPIWLDVLKNRKNTWCLECFGESLGNQGA